MTDSSSEVISIPGSDWKVSDIRGAHPKLRFSVFWKIYVVVLALLVALAPAVVLSTDPTVFDWIDLPASALLIVGLFGFAFRRRVLSQAFWRGAFFALLAWSVLYNFVISRLVELGQRGIPAPLWNMVAGIAILLPAYVGLYLYAFGSEDFWQEAPSAGAPPRGFTASSLMSVSSMKREHMTIPREQREVLTELLSKLTPGHISTLVASLNEPDSQIGTSTDSENYAFLQKMSEFGLAEQIPLNVGLPPDLQDVLTSFSVNDEGKAEIETLLKAASMNRGREG